MKHEVVWNEAHGCVHLELRGPLTVEHAAAFLDDIEALLDKASKRYLLIDRTAAEAMAWFDAD